MFIGHFALGFAAKRATPRLGLAWLFVAAQFADLLWPILLAAGIEQVRIDPGNTAFTPLDFVSYPYSHSLLLLCVWGIGLGWLGRRTVNDRGVAPVVAALVVSHWILDFLTHRPDMPLYPGGPKLGLGLWNSVPATMVVELALYAIGVLVYARSTRPRDRIGRWSFTGLVVFLPIAYVVNFAGPLPPSIAVIWVSAIAGAGVLLIWSWWTDRHREAVT